MQKKLWLSIVTAMIGVGLLVAASFAGSASSASQSKGSKSKVGGTLRVNLSTTDLEYTDPALDYESTGWQVEYATGLKLLNWKETRRRCSQRQLRLPAGRGRRQALHVHDSPRT